MIFNIDFVIMEMCMMLVLFVVGVKIDNEGNLIRVNYIVGVGDFIIIFKKVLNKEFVKKFLLFLVKDESIVIFIEKINGVLFVMNYDMVELDSLNLLEFFKLIIEIN